MMKQGLPIAGLVSNPTIVPYGSFRRFAIKKTAIEVIEGKIIPGSNVL
jgi:hypothetical protein